MSRPGGDSCEVGYLRNIDVEETITHCRPHSRRHDARRGISIDQHAALWLRRRDLPIGFAQAFMEFDVFRLESVRRAVAAPRGGALQTDLDGNVEDDRQVRFEIADGDPLE